jgi:hypothetical protein
MESKPFDIPYVLQVLADIYGREHGITIKATATLKETKQNKNAPPGATNT